MMLGDRSGRTAMEQPTPPYPAEAKVPEQFKDEPFDKLPPGPQDRVRRALASSETAAPGD